MVSSQFLVPFLVCTPQISTTAPNHCSTFQPKLCSALSFFNKGLEWSGRGGGGSSGVKSVKYIGQGERSEFSVPSRRTGHQGKAAETYVLL